MTWCYATNGNESSSCGNCRLFKSIPDLVRLSTIRLSGVVGLCSLIFLLISVLAGTAEENLRLQPAAQPGREAERLHGVPPTRLGLQSVLRQVNKIRKIFRENILIYENISGGTDWEPMPGPFLHQTSS